MILNDREIRALLRQGEFLLDPYEDGLVQPSSIDLRLDRFARAVKGSTEEFDIRDIRVDELYEEIRIDDQGIVIPPRGVLIGQTMEHMTIPATCQGMIAQRSSVMRLGVQVSSSLINPGYAGNLPCLVNNHTERPIRIFAGVPICQLVLVRLSGRPDVTYPEKSDAKYHQERKFLVSGVAEDARRWLRPGPRLAHPEEAEDFRMEVSVEEASDDTVR